MDDLGVPLFSETSIWVFPQMVVPPKHPKIIILVGKPMVFGETHHFRKHPYVDSKATPPVTTNLIFVPQLWSIEASSWPQTYRDDAMDVWGCKKEKMVKSSIDTFFLFQGVTTFSVFFFLIFPEIYIIWLMDAVWRCLFFSCRANILNVVTHKRMQLEHQHIFFHMRRSTHTPDMSIDGPSGTFTQHS